MCPLFLHVYLLMMGCLFTFQYLKEQRLPPQTFIPIQSVRVKPVHEKLRALGGSARLIFDVVQYPLENALIGISVSVNVAGSSRA